MAKYTPGPWRISDTLSLDGCALILSDFSEYGTIQLARIPDYSNDSTEQENARLIAASPILLGELTELVWKSETSLRYLQSVCDGMKDEKVKGYLQGFIEELARRVISARATIDKAEGRQ